MTRSLEVLLAVALVSGAAPSLARAQDEPKPEEKKPDAPKPDAPDKKPAGGRPQRWQYPIDMLKEKLSLTDDQYKKLEGFNQEMSDAWKAEMADLQKGGDFDWNKMRDKMKENIEAMRNKIRGVLTDEQKPKFEEIIKEQNQQMQRGPRMGPDPEQMKKRLYDQAERELVLTAEEKSAVMPLVKKLLDVRAEARIANDKRKEAFTDFVRKATGTSDEQKKEITDKLNELRKAREADAQRVKDAQASVREVLTIDNEAKLVALGILD
jgi:hypothetical protein